MDSDILGTQLSLELVELHIKSWRCFPVYFDKDTTSKRILLGENAIHGTVHLIACVKAHTTGNRPDDLPVNAMPVGLLYSSLKLGSHLPPSTAFLALTSR